MGEQEKMDEIALQLSKLQNDQREEIEEYIKRLSGVQNAQEFISEKYLTFWCGEQLFGVCISQVVQIIQVPKITPIPDAPHYIKGVICMRDEVIPILDLRLRLGKPEIDYDSHTCVIIVTLQSGSLGLVVDFVNDVETIPDENIHIPIKQQDGSVAYLKGIVKSGSPTLLIDVDLLLGADEVETLLDASKAAQDNVEREKENA